MATGSDLHSTLREQAAYQESYAQAEPVACPNDGEPLRQGPEGVLFCPFDGFQWPRDWNPSTMSGM